MPLDSSILYICFISCICIYGQVRLYPRARTPCKFPKKLPAANEKNIHWTYHPVGLPPFVSIGIILLVKNPALAGCIFFPFKTSSPTNIPQIMASKEPSTHSWHPVRPPNVQQPTLRVCLKNDNTSPSALVYCSKQNFPPNFDRSQTCAVSYSRRPVRLKCLLPQAQQKYIPPFFGHPNTIPKKTNPPKSAPRKHQRFCTRVDGPDLAAVQPWGETKPPCAAFKAGGNRTRRSVRLHTYWTYCI